MTPFNAQPHPYLVPFKGGFRVDKAPTSPDKKTLKSIDWRDNLEKKKERIGRLQHQLFADNRYALLIVFQAMDAGGKDSTIRHVLTGVNPTGVRVTSFKKPSALELQHDFLWRSVAHLPARGEIGVFNRSYYEEVLVVRVRPELLAAQRSPEPAAESTWLDRLHRINDHERHLAASGTVILKFWLNVSKEEQRRRFLKRIERPNKRWKFRAADLNERELWDDYMDCYDACLNATSKPWAPWYAIPADDKPFMRWQVADLIAGALGQLGLAFPVVSGEAEAELEAAARALGRP